MPGRPPFAITTHRRKKLSIRFTEEDWQRIERDWTAWWAGELDRPLVVLESTDPAERERLPTVHNFMSNYPLDMPADAVLDLYEAHLETRHFHGDAWPRWWPNFGPGVIAAFLGSQVHSHPETVWFAPTREIPIADLEPMYDPDNQWWQRVRELTERAVERWGNQVQVSHTDLGENFDILTGLRDSQQVLVDLYDAPDEVARLINELHRLWIRYYEELYTIIRRAGRGTSPWAAIWSPGRCYMLQSDFSYMISPQMFERFVLPELAACCEFLDHACYHLDGQGQIAHLDRLLSLESLHAIQWVPGHGNPPPEEWLPLLQRVRDHGKLCQLYVSPSGALSIVRALGGKGFAFCIREPMSPTEAEDYVRLLQTESTKKGTTG